LDNKYTDNNPKSQFGNQKLPIAWIPKAGIIEQAKVHKHGGDKYGPYNWRGEGVTVSAMVYASAILRHFYDWLDRRDIDPDSGANHLGHISANCNILLDAMEHGNLIDDRPGREPGCESPVGTVEPVTPKETPYGLTPMGEFTKKE